MKAEELRINNLVTLSDKVRQELFENQINAQNEYFKVKTIYSDNTIALELDSEIVDIDENDVDGIPLSEQWLLDFGFEVKAVSVTHNYSYSIGFFVLSNGLRNNISYDGHEIKYVHQLQNLYYSLCGKELVGI